MPEAEQPAPIDRHPAGQPHPKVPVAIGLGHVERQRRNRTDVDVRRPFLHHAERVALGIGVVVGIQVLLWIAGGLVMSAFPIELVRGETQTATIEPTPIAMQRKKNKSLRHDERISRLVKLKIKFIN